MSQGKNPNNKELMTMLLANQQVTLMGIATVLRVLKYDGKIPNQCIEAARITREVLELWNSDILPDSPDLQ